MSETMVVPKTLSFVSLSKSTKECTNSLVDRQYSPVQWLRFLVLSLAYVAWRQ